MAFGSHDVMVFAGYFALWPSSLYRRKEHPSFQAYGSLLQNYVRFC